MSNHRVNYPALPRERDWETVRQHLSWISLYAESIDASNYADMRLLLERQLTELRKELLL